MTMERLEFHGGMLPRSTMLPIISVWEWKSNIIQAFIITPRPIWPQVTTILAAEGYALPWAGCGDNFPYPESLANSVSIPTKV